jgi:hypothetical protein
LLADTQMSTEAHRQTTPVKEEWLAECGVQTDAHIPGSHIEAPHTPAEKRSVHHATFAPGAASGRAVCCSVYRAVLRHVQLTQ